ncbi:MULTISPECIES: hypothetical protein [Pseudomonas syringae group]|uniref:hypothetical protein n=1 Tax=Pseudomonas syringae group TaxID=136849 RepID=UPI0011C38727|nr:MULTISPECIES: hypothetical protein [Pseudomonas syringae group]
MTISLSYRLLCTRTEETYQFGSAVATDRVFSGVSQSFTEHLTWIRWKNWRQWVKFAGRKLNKKEENDPAKQCGGRH